MTGISVVKGHAYGNDFLLVPEAEVAGHNLEQLAQAMCHRQTGIGADGLMVYAHDGDRVRMRLFNADGSASEVSGNGVRCLAALVVRESPRTSRVTIDTPAGPKVLDLVARSGDTLTFRASMGQPEDIRLVDLDAAGERVRAVALSVGNPQCVLLNDPLEPQRFQKLGPALEHHRGVSEPDERVVRAGGSARSPPHPDLGARRGAHHGLRHRRVRRGRRRRGARRGRTRRRSDFTRGKSARGVASRGQQSDLPDRLGPAGLRRPLRGSFRLILPRRAAQNHQPFSSSTARPGAAARHQRVHLANRRP